MINDAAIVADTGKEPLHMHFTTAQPPRAKGLTMSIQTHAAALNNNPHAEQPQDSTCAAGLEDVDEPATLQVRLRVRPLCESDLAKDFVPLLQQLSTAVRVDPVFFR